MKSQIYLKLAFLIYSINLYKNIKRFLERKGKLTYEWSDLKQFKIYKLDQNIK